MACSDRRWPETYRVLGLQGVEMILTGYNTPVHNPPAPEHDPLSQFHKTTTFNFARHREPEHYRMIVERKGAAVPLDEAEGLTAWPR